MGSGDGLVLWGNKPLPEPILTTICHQMVSLGHNDLICLYAWLEGSNTKDRPVGQIDVPRNCWSNEKSQERNKLIKAEMFALLTRVTSNTKIPLAAFMSWWPDDKSACIQVMAGCQAVVKCQLIMLNWGNIKCMCIIYHFSALGWHRQLKSFSRKDNDQCKQHIHHHGCWCHGSLHHQVIRNHVMTKQVKRICSFNEKRFQLHLSSQCERITENANTETWIQHDMDIFYCSLC